VHLQKSRARTDDKAPAQKRLTIDLSVRQHVYLKGRAAKAQLTMRDLVLETLDQAGLLGPRGGRRR
jgi:hypothetical protein